MNQLYVKSSVESLRLTNRIPVKSTAVLSPLNHADGPFLCSWMLCNFVLFLRLMLQLMCWQDWVFSLAYFEPQDRGNFYRFIPDLQRINGASQLSYDLFGVTYILFHHEYP